MRSFAISLLLPMALLGARGLATPNVTVVPGPPPRVAVRCDEGRVELGPGLVAYGTGGVGERAFAEVKRGDATITCTSERGHAQARLAPMGLRSIVPRRVKDAAGARVVLTLEGQSLGPFGAADDGVYLVQSSGVVRLDAACPEQRVEPGRVVACATEAQLHGPARVRLQSAGRLEEAQGVLDLAGLEKRP